MSKTRLKQLLEVYHTDSTSSTIHLSPRRLRRAARLLLEARRTFQFSDDLADPTVRQFYERMWNDFVKEIDKTFRNHENKNQ